MARPLALRQPVTLQPGMGVRRMLSQAPMLIKDTDTLQMMSPTAPLANKQLIWHLYSAQAYGVSCTVITSNALFTNTIIDLPRRP